MSDTREERIAAITRGLWRAPKPPHGRYLVKVSYEDSSDVCDWFETHDDFEEAVDVYRAYWVWDLDGSAKWDVEAVNVARLVSGGDEGNTP